MNRLRRAIQFVFGCRHRHLSRVFTINQRTYKVCFDCGKEFDLPNGNTPEQSGDADTGRRLA